MSFVKGVYAVAIGVLIVLLVGFGIETFYPAPEFGDFPGLEEYLEAQAPYHGNVFLVVLPLGALIAAGGALLRRRLPIFGAGLILGGTCTMIYAIVPSRLDSLFRFIGIAVALTVLIFVGFRVFNSSRQKTEGAASP